LSYCYELSKQKKQANSSLKHCKEEIVIKLNNSACKISKALTLN